MKRLVLLAALLAWAGIAAAAVNVNQASVEELEVLEGIGPVKAQAIVDYRRRHGGFKSLEELLHVAGIGEATLQRIRKDVSLTSAPASAGDAARAARRDEDKKK